jgi:hypothetical protein
MTPKTIQRSSVTQFAELVQRGVECWLDAGKIVCAEIDNDPDWPDKVHEQHPEIGLATIYSFERIGRMELHPQLLVADSPGARKLRQLPYSLQVKYTNSPLEVLTKTETGWEQLLVGVHNLTSKQANQVFDANNIRTPEAQRAWIESQATQEASADLAKNANEPYRVVGKQLVVLHPCRLTITQLAQAIAQMS